MELFYYNLFSDYKSVILLSKGNLKEKKKPVLKIKPYIYLTLELHFGET